MREALTNALADPGRPVAVIELIAFRRRSRSSRRIRTPLSSSSICSSRTRQTRTYPRAFGRPGRRRRSSWCRRRTSARRCSPRSHAAPRASSPSGPTRRCDGRAAPRARRGRDVPSEVLREEMARLGCWSGPRRRGHALAQQRELGLTPRQMDVLVLLVQGKPTRSSRASEPCHRNGEDAYCGDLPALGVANRTEAVFAASRRGIRFRPGMRICQRGPCLDRERGKRALPSRGWASDRLAGDMT